MVGVTTTETDTDLHPFDADTRVSPAGDGLFTGEFTDRWNALGGVVNGGFYVAVALQALKQVLPHPDPLAVSSFLLRAGSAGPLEVRADVARHGRRVSTGTARIVQAGKELARTTATFADLSRSSGGAVEAALTSPPVLPPPDEAIDPIGDQPIPGVTMLDQVEYRTESVPGWRRGRPDGDPSAEFWMRFTGGRDADTLSLPMLVDAAAPVVLDLGVAGSMTMELTTYVRRVPAPGWLACRVSTRHVTGGFHEEDFEIWDSSGALVAQSRQLALLVTG